jgi:hypothetical protein
MTRPQNLHKPQKQNFCSVATQTSIVSDGVDAPRRHLCARMAVLRTANRGGVMPPVARWAGDMQLDGYAPHAVDWALYVDGEEVGRVSPNAMAWERL